MLKCDSCLSEGSCNAAADIFELWICGSLQDDASGAVSSGDLGGGAMSALVALVEPHYPDGARGRPPIGVERMLRIYFLQQWFNLSDPQAEDAIYDIASMRSFAGIDLGREAAPDETTICKFRQVIEAHGLGAEIFAGVNEHLKAKGVKIGTGTIMDATIIAGPSWTKNARGKRDPEMHQV
jgi:transposase, IS5 family